MVMILVCDIIILLEIDIGFVGFKVYMVGYVFFKKKDYKLVNIKLGIKVMIQNVKVFIIKYKL